MTGMEHAIERAAELLNAEGACCGDCGREPGAPLSECPACERFLTGYARALADAGLLAHAPLREEALADEPKPWRCPGCNSDRWVRASLTRGLTVITQCVPCGRYVNCPPPGRAAGDGRADQ